jgi:hypothetical protein
VDNTFWRDDFTYEHAADTYRCPAGKTFQHCRGGSQYRGPGIMKDNSTRYRASKRDCQACPSMPTFAPPKAAV